MMLISHWLNFSTPEEALAFIREFLECREDFSKLRYALTGSQIRLSDRTYYLIQDSIQHWVAVQR